MPKHWTWPAQGVWIKTSDTTSKRQLKLHPKDARQVRCVLERYLHSPQAANAVAKNFRHRLARWRVGAVNGSGPKIGTFWIRLGERDNEIVLRNTLETRRWGRYGLVAKMRREPDGWRIHAFGPWRAHHRR